MFAASGVFVQRNPYLFSEIVERPEPRALAFARKKFTLGTTHAKSVF